MKMTLCPVFRPASRAAFTVIELLVVVALLGLGVLMLLPALARTQPNTKAVQCQNNLRQLTMAWQLYAGDNRDSLVAPAFDILTPGRPAWVSNFTDVPPLEYDPSKELTSSPLWPYCGKKEALFKCPADSTRLFVNGMFRPRLRTYSMSQVFGSGEWLTGTYNPDQTV